MLRAARKVGIADRTLRRARQTIGAQTEKVGFTRGWEWWLPDPATKRPSQPKEPASLHQVASPQVLATSGRIELGEDEISEIGRLPFGELERRYGDADDG